MLSSRGIGDQEAVEGLPQGRCAHGVDLLDTVSRTDVGEVLNGIQNTGNALGVQGAVGIDVGHKVQVEDLLGYGFDAAAGIQANDLGPRRAGADVDHRGQRIVSRGNGALPLITQTVLRPLLEGAEFRVQNEVVFAGGRSLVKCGMTGPAARIE